MSSLQVAPRRSQTESLRREQQPSVQAPTPVRKPQRAPVDDVPPKPPVKDPVVPPSKVTTAQINPVHFKTLEGVCLRALEKDPASRYATAQQFADDLTRWLMGQDFRVSDPKLRRWVLWSSLAAAVCRVRARLLVTHTASRGSSRARVAKISASVQSQSRSLWP